MKGRLRHVGTAVAVAALVGCTQTRSYTVSVRNELTRPVTVCMTKTAGPAEEGWETPEQVAGPAFPATDDRPPGVIVRPGKTASSKEPVSGDFYRRGRAILRVYVGATTLSQILAMSPGDLDRLDVPLHAGANVIVVQQGPDGRVRALPAGGPPAADP